VTGLGTFYEPIKTLILSPTAQYPARQFGIIIGAQETLQVLERPNPAGGALSGFPIIFTGIGHLPLDIFQPLLNVSVDIQ
jgi:hypothetical protein